MTHMAIPAAAAADSPAAVVVRTPAGVLHLVPDDVAVPRLPVFTVALLCVADVDQAPAVRAHSGPWDERKACRRCVRAWRGEPEPPTPVVEELPGAEPVMPETPAVPQLPAEHRGRALEWRMNAEGAAPSVAWEPQPWVTHVDHSCEHCGDPGPGLMVQGVGRDPLGNYMAFRCPVCQHMRVYEVLTGWEMGLIFEYRGVAARTGVR